MDLKEELRIMVKYILPKEQHDKDVIENCVDTLTLINEEYVKQLSIPDVGSQRELLINQLESLDHNNMVDLNNCKFDKVADDLIKKVN